MLPVVWQLEAGCIVNLHCLLDASPLKEVQTAPCACFWGYGRPSSDVRLRTVVLESFFGSFFVRSEDGEAGLFEGRRRGILRQSLSGQPPVRVCNYMIGKVFGMRSKRMGART